MADHGHHEESQRVHGLIAEFNDPDTLLHAAETTYKAGFRDVEAYSPFPIHGLAESIGFTKCGVAPITLIGGLTGTSTAFLLQYISQVMHYSWDIGGKPDFSWPSFVPVLFELTVLFAGFSALGSMLILNGLPRPHHPIFNAKRFERASSDGFFLCIESTDAQYDTNKTKDFLQGLHPVEVSEVHE